MMKIYLSIQVHFDVVGCTHTHTHTVETTHIIIKILRYSSPTTEASASLTSNDSNLILKFIAFDKYTYQNRWYDICFAWRMCVCMSIEHIAIARVSIESKKIAATKYPRDFLRIYTNKVFMK